jgi:citrate lyase beta subunit
MSNTRPLEPEVQFISADAFVTDALAAYTMGVRASAPPRDHDSATGAWATPQDFALELLRAVLVRVCERAARAGVPLGVAVTVNGAGQVGFASDCEAGRAVGCGVAL